MLVGVLINSVRPSGFARPEANFDCSLSLFLFELLLKTEYLRYNNSYDVQHRRLCFNDSNFHSSIVIILDANVRYFPLVSCMHELSYRSVEFTHSQFESQLQIKFIEIKSLKFFQLRLLTAAYFFGIHFFATTAPAIPYHFQLLFCASTFFVLDLKWRSFRSFIPYFIIVVVLLGRWLWLLQTCVLFKIFRAKEIK